MNALTKQKEQPLHIHKWDTFLSVIFEDAALRAMVEDDQAEAALEEEHTASALALDAAAAIILNMKDFHSDSFPTRLACRVLTVQKGYQLG